MKSFWVLLVSLQRATGFSLLVFMPILFSGTVLFAQGKAETYVGMEACKGCHEKQYARFTTHSRMSSSFSGISRMKKGLTGEEVKRCYECHTTGYGKPGGFTSETETPGLKNLGCEACHGPGSGHVSSGNPKEIKRRLDTPDCDACHAKERVAAFNYRPLLYGGAH